jgi:hypothetical protein
MISNRPGQHEEIDEVYRGASEAGRHGVDCPKLYPDCPMGHGILDSVSFVENDLNFNKILRLL